jgi:putative ABC transport system permease protein
VSALTATRGSRRVGAGIAVAVALGAGACIALLTVQENVFAPPSSYSNPDRLVIVENRGAYDLGPDITIERAELSWPDFRDLVEQQRSFEAIGALSRTDQIAWDVDGRLRSAWRVFVSEDLLATLGVRPVAGRLLGTADFEPQAPAVALVSERLWRSHLRSDPAVVGRSYQVDGVLTMVVGVVADDVVGSLRQRTEVFEDADRDQRLILPLAPGRKGRTGATLALRYQNRSSPMLTVVARLRPDMTLGSARTDVGLLSQRLGDEFAQTNRGRTMEPVRFAEWRTPQVIHLRPLLIAVALLALLVACASAAGLMMSDGVRRGPEMAVRHALGATHAALASLVLRRAMAWAVPGGLLGIAFAWGMLRLVDAAGLSESTATRVSAGPWLFAGAAALGVFAGLVLAAAGIGMLRQQNLSAGLEDDAGRCRGAESKRQLAEVLVERDDDPLLLLSASQNFHVLSAGRLLVHPHGIVPLSPQGGDRGAGHVLVREEPSAHELPRRKRIDLLGLHHSAGVLQAGVNVRRGQRRVASEDICFRPSLGQQVDDQLHGQTRSPHDGFSHENRRIDHDPLLPGHVR